MNDITIFIDGLGVLAFGLATAYSYLAYRQTRKTAGYWMMYAVGMALGTFWSLLVLLESLNIEPTVMNDFQQPLIAAMGVTLALVARLTHDGLIKASE